MRKIKPSDQFESSTEFRGERFPGAFELRFLPFATHSTTEISACGAALAVFWFWSDIVVVSLALGRLSVGNQ